MLDDNNAKEMEAALREEEELDIPDGMTSEDWQRIQEEAQAEEEFIADREDTVRPLVFQKKNTDGSVTTIDTRPETHSVDASDGVLGSGDLETDRVGEPVNNEEELRKESVEDMDEDPIKTTDDAAEPVADAPVEDAGSEGENATEPVATDSPEDAAPASEPEAEPEVPADDAVKEEAPAATDAPTPIPGGMPTSPVSTDAPAAAPAEPKKKKKTGLIFGIIALLLLIGGGIAGWFVYYNMHEDPEKQVKDAVSNIFRAKTAGATKVEAIESGKLPYIGFNMSTSSEQLGGDLSMSFDFALKGTGTFYIKLGGLDSIAPLAKTFMMGGMGSGATTNSNVDTDKLMSAIINPINNKWIAIDTDDEEVKATVSCMSESLNAVLSENFRNKAGDAFDKYPFVKYKKDSKVETRGDIKFYEVEIDEGMQEKFSKELEGADELKTFETCVSKFGGAGSVTKTTARLSTSTVKDDDEDEDEDDDDYDYEEYEVDGELEEDDDMTFGVSVAEGTTNTIKFGISSWSHELQAIEVITEAKDGTKVTSTVTFKAISESDLLEAKSVENVVKDIVSGIAKYAAEYSCDQALEKYGEDEFKKEFKDKQECIDKVEKELEGDMDVSQMLGGLSGVQTRMRI